MDLTTVNAIKRFLGLDVDDRKDDGLLQTLADAANAAIASALSRDLVSATYTEVRDGTGTSTLMLANFPVTAVSSVALGAPVASAVLTEGRDFTFTTYGVKLYSGVFPRGVANVTVTYIAGYASVPPDVRHAATKWAALRYRELERLGQRSKTLQGETVEFDLSEMPPDVLGIINRYQSRIPLVSRGR